MRVRLEGRNGCLTWRGTLIAFARANAMQPWEMFELQEKLEQQGDVTLPYDGETRSTLYNEGIEKGAASRPSMLPGAAWTIIP